MLLASRVADTSSRLRAQPAKGARTSTSPTEVALADLSAEKVVDTRGNCVGGLLDARRAIARIGLGKVLELWSSDSCCKKQIRAWAGKAGHEFLGFRPARGYERIFVRRTR